MAEEWRWRFGEDNRCPHCGSRSVVLAVPHERPSWKGGLYILTCEDCKAQDRDALKRPVDAAMGRWALEHHFDIEEA